MSHPSKILVPTDFSPHADRALEYAMDLAAKLGASVHVLHVFEVPVLSLPEAPWVVTSELIDTIERASKRALDELVKKHQRSDVPLTPLLRSGEARSQIDAAAAEIGADLVCMGTHGRTGLARALLGSVAEYVVRTSSVPVLTLHTK
jgi:nucleotide-binding universal stress UspA family protein